MENNFLKYSLSSTALLIAYPLIMFALQVPFLSPKISPSQSSPRKPEIPSSPPIQALPPPPPNEGTQALASLHVIK